jgi:hypothetical protein
MDLSVPQEEGAEPKPLIDRLDEAAGRIKGQPCGGCGAVDD